MRHIAICGLALAAMLLCNGAWAAPDPAIVRFQSGSASDLASPQADKWNTALKLALMVKPDEQAAAASLAPHFGLSVENTLRLERLWMRFVDGYWDSDADADAGRGRAAIEREFLALAADTRHDPTVVALAATALSRGESCDTQNFRALVSGEPRFADTVWPVAIASHCRSWLAAYAASAPEKSPAVLAALARGSEFNLAEALAAGQRAGEPDILAAVAEAGRADYRRHMAYLQIQRLFADGLTGEGLAYYNALPADDRRSLIDDPRKAVDVQVNGLTVPLETISSAPLEFHDGKPIQLNNSASDMRFDLAAAYFVVGRSDEARALLPADQLAAARQGLLCRHASAGRPPGRRDVCDVGDSDVGGSKAALLDYALVHPADDPYDYFETYYGQSFGGPPSEGSALWADVLCKFLGLSPYDFQCAEERKSAGRAFAFRNGEIGRNTRDGATFAVLATVNPGLRTLRDGFAAKLVQVRKMFPSPGRDAGNRDTLGPLPSRFAQAPLPAVYRGPVSPGSSAWIKNLAPLPEGYSLVRAERSGHRVAAITLSQNYDPTGEVSAGGYWVHLSQDGGKSWGQPLYTGLADHFPYVVVPRSNMKLFHGEALDVEVEISEVDMSSVTYPPVALRSKRHESGLYLTIPLAELTRDSDHDGLTDIAEEHLLLDPNNADSDGDGIPDGADPLPNVNHAGHAAPEQEALAALLAQRFSVPMGAIIQPVDARIGPGRLAAAMRGSAAEAVSADRPIFIDGEPSDFAGLRPGRMILVYGKSDLEKLKRLTPDFHAVSLGHMVFNRAHDRGYVTWSMGWTGGTAGFVLKDGKWKVFDLSNWIT